jgi:hypothetical protein
VPIAALAALESGIQALRDGIGAEVASGVGYDPKPAFGGASLNLV